MGFGFDSYVDILYSYVTGLEWSLGIHGTLPADVAEKIGFANNFKGCLIGISIVGIFLAVVHFKNSK